VAAEVNTKIKRVVCSRGRKYAVGTGPTNTTRNGLIRTDPFELVRSEKRFEQPLDQLRFEASRLCPSMPPLPGLAFTFFTSPSLTSLMTRGMTRTLPKLHS
jgi:hypothetical protein